MKNIIFLSIFFLGCNNYKELPSIITPTTRITDEKGIANFCSVNGGKITFSGNTTGNFKLYIKNIEEKAITQLTFGKYDDVFPQFSHNSKNIVFSSNRYGSFDVFIIDSEKKGGIKQITFDNKGDEIFPSFSSDGKKIVFTSVSKDIPIITVIDLETGLSTEITSGFFGRFSPFSNNILFNRESLDSIDIRMIDIDGKNERLIFHNEEFDCLFPSFSPSGSHIVYVACRKGGIKEFRLNIKDLNTQIRCIDIGGGNDTKVTEGIFPLWIDDFIYFSSQRGDILDIFRVPAPEDRVSQHEEIAKEKIEEKIEVPPKVVTKEESKEIKMIFPKPSEIEPKTEVITTKDNVAIWSYPGKSVITHLDKGVKLIVIDCSKKWYIKVLLADGRQGWISCFFVE